MRMTCPVPIEVLLFVTKIVPSSSTVIPPGAESVLYTGEIALVPASTRTTAPGVAHPGRNGGPGPGPNCDTYRSPSGPNAIDTTWRRPPAQSTHAPVVAPITQCTSREPGSTRQICDGTTNGNPRNSPTYHAPSGPMAILVGTACTVGPPMDTPGGEVRTRDWEPSETPRPYAPYRRDRPGATYSRPRRRPTCCHPPPLPPHRDWSREPRRRGCASIREVRYPR